jgi:hypothetical protein
LVPPVINPEVEKLLPGARDQILITLWRHGRNWDTRNQGAPLINGYFAQIDRNKLGSLKDHFKLILEVYKGHDLKLIDFFNQREIELW